ncbi:MAG: outer membrane beta-barrel protein [Bacteroidota bacterium]
MLFGCLRIFSAGLFCFITSFGYSQISVEENYMGFLPPKDPDAPQRMHRYMFNIQHVNWLDVPAGVKAEPWSYGFDAFRFIEFPNTKNTFSLAVGFGWSSYHFYNNAAVTTTIDMSTMKEFTTLVPFDPSYEYKRHQLAMHYFDGAFQLRWRTNKKNIVYLYPGFKFGYLFNNHTKTIDNDSKFKVYDMKGIEHLRLGPTIHAGINRWSLTGFYSLTPLFEQGKGEQITVFSAGVSFNLF